MKGLFSFGAGLALGAFGYRYYLGNGWRRPLQQMTSQVTDKVFEQGEAQRPVSHATQQSMRASVERTDDGMINMPRPGLTTVPHEQAVPGGD
ncbi:MAG TPA: hypothetical protein VFS62_02295 [Chloroflexota bacterium]|jgi:hypothetical protein|nr:hypothetical protein [Chloroflexota bacterium]